MEKQYVDSAFTPDPDSIPSLDAPHENAWYNGRDFDGYRVAEQPLFTKRKIRLICVGAGATGIQVAYKAERLLENVDVMVYDKNDDVGGTWLENRYPGCECDIPSHSYQFDWARNPQWSHYYSPAPEILQYFKDVVAKFHLMKYIHLRHTINSTTWNEETGMWRLSITKPDGSITEDSCEILINGGGILNSWKYPDIPGIDTFKGKLMHSARWDDTYDFTGKTVAVIGGGSSAVQIIPRLQKVATKLIPFLRSPVWITTGFGAKFAGPEGTNFAYPEEQIKEFQENPELYDEYCRDLEGELNKRFTLNHLYSKAQKDSRELVTDMMKKLLNDDPNLVDHIVPNYALGCRRMTPGTGYLRSLTQPNVHVVKEACVRFTEYGVVDESGTEHEVDAIVCATGFETSFSPHFDVIGRNGRHLRDSFGDFPKAYMAIMAEGFPNLFHFLGPNGPVSHGSLLPILEWQTRHTFKMIDKLQREGIKSYDPKAECIRELYNHTHEMVKRLSWSASCRSWFKNGKRIGPVTAIWAGSRLHWFETTREPRYEDYNITYLSQNRYQYLGNGYTITETSMDGNPVWYFDDEFCRV